MHQLRLIKESLIFAYNQVIVNKLRTLLSLLGITIGIFAIISVFTAVDSLEKNIRENISALGSDIVYIQKWPWSFGADYPWWDYMKRPVPDMRDFEAIQRKCQLAQDVSFSVSAGRTVKYKENAADNVGVWANSYEFQNIRPFELAEGRYFSYFESYSGRNVALIGSELATKLFGENQDPLNKVIKVAGQKVMIIGVIKKEGNSILGGGSLDNFVLLPINYAKNVFDIKSDRLNPMIMVQAKQGVSTAQLMDELRMIMRSARRLRPTEEDNFALNRSSLISQGIDQIFVVINLAGWIIGGFSILVGGFGIANIMFVSVKERTRIIGIQKALGAKKSFILLQFLYEAVILAVSGGLVGLLLVFAGTWVVRLVSDFTIALSLGNVVLGLGISAVIGIISGFTPAYNASRLNPVVAINTSF